MQILHLEASTGWGGQEIRIFREAVGMRQRGHAVYFAVMRGAALGKKAKEAGFSVYELNFRRSGWIGTFYRLCRILQSHQIDVVNTHSSLDAWIGGLASRFMKRKIVRTRHLSTPIKPGFNSRFLYGYLADFVVSTCCAILPTISVQSGKPLARCRSIPTGIDVHAIDVKPAEASRFRAQIGVHPDQFLVGTACVMRSWKGIADLLQAAHLLRHVPDLRWVIIGGGHAETYRALAKELSLEKIVLFTGHLEDPFPAIQALDLFALLSTAHEGVSQAILQAAWLERPLLATNTGGLGEVCIDGITGLQVEPFSPGQVAAQVLSLKGDPSTRLQLGKQAKAHVENHFLWPSTLDQMEAVFHTLGNHPAV